jgi:hypothetical protein
MAIPKAVAIEHDSLGSLRAYNCVNLDLAKCGSLEKRGATMETLMKMDPALGVISLDCKNGLCDMKLGNLFHLLLATPINPNH